MEDLVYPKAEEVLFKLLNRIDKVNPTDVFKTAET